MLIMVVIILNGIELSKLQSTVGSAGKQRRGGKRGPGGDARPGSASKAGLVSLRTQDTTEFEQSKMRYDSTGMFHWCPSRDLKDSLMDRQEAAMAVLQVGPELDNIQTVSTCTIM